MVAVGIIGASGMVGQYLAEGFIANGSYQVSLLTRKVGVRVRDRGGSRGLDEDDVMRGMDAYAWDALKCAGQRNRGPTHDRAMVIQSLPLRH